MKINTVRNAYVSLLLAGTMLISACGSSESPSLPAEAAGNTEESGTDPATSTDPSDAATGGASDDTDPGSGGTGGDAVIADDPDTGSTPVSSDAPSVPTESGDAGDGGTAGTGSDAADGAGTTESGGAAASDTAPIGHDPSLPHEPQPPQSGILTAGDYDDQLNPWWYQQYSNHYLSNVRPQQNLPTLDLIQRVPVTVVDNKSVPYAGASIYLLDQQGNHIKRVITPASGTAYLYRDLDGLNDELNLIVEDRFGDVSLQRKFQLNSTQQQQSFTIELPTVNVPNNMLDLQLVIDTTGSMGDELAYLQSELTSILNRVQQAHPQVSIHAGLVVYRDHGDQYVVRSYPFTNDLDDLQQSLNSESFNGGGDYPEAMDEALAEAMRFQWREQSSKISLLVADAPPHSHSVNATWQSALEARSRQIHIVPVAASGVGEDAEYLMRSMAALTNSRYLFLTDDSGVGNPHAEPMIDCYIVTRLDGLIKRVIDQVITGNRTEPSHNEVIRQVGNYDNGVCGAVDPQQ